jgi:uncharacterized protein YaiI (UPF0178 family)
MNVIGSRPDGWWRDRPAAMRRLTADLDRFAAANDGDVLVVFDGAPHDIESNDVEVRFARRRGQNAADDDIADLAEPGDIVVTSDDDLARRVTARGASTVGAKAFREQL